VERKVNRIALALAVAEVRDVAGTGKVVAVLVERAGHHSVGRVECLLYAIAMVNIDIDVEHTRVLFEELEDAEHAVVDVTKPRRLSFLGMVKASYLTH